MQATVQAAGLRETIREIGRSTHDMDELGLARAIVALSDEIRPFNAAYDEVKVAVEGATAEEITTDMYKAAQVWMRSLPDYRIAGFYPVDRAHALFRMSGRGGDLVPFVYLIAVRYVNPREGYYMVKRIAEVIE